MSGFCKLEMSGFRHPVGPGGRHEGRGKPDDECEKTRPVGDHQSCYRALIDDEDLDLIFTWQEERKLSRNLTFQYKRVMYLVEPGPETLTLAGERCCVLGRLRGKIGPSIRLGSRGPC